MNEKWNPPDAEANDKGKQRTTDEDMNEKKPAKRPYNRRVAPAAELEPASNASVVPAVMPKASNESAVPAAEPGASNASVVPTSDAKA